MGIRLNLMSKLQYYDTMYCTFKGIYFKHVMILKFILLYWKPHFPSTSVFLLLTMLISTVRIARSAIRITVELRLNTSTHVLRALKWTTFCQGMQLKKYGHFGTGTSHQNPVSIKMFSTRLFSALACIAD